MIWSGKVGPIDIKIKDLVIPWEVHVGDISHDMIMGLDLLFYLDMDLNLKESKVVLGDRVVTCNKEPNGDEQKMVMESEGKKYKVIPVKLNSKLKLMGETEVVLPVKGNFDVGSQVVLFEPTVRSGLPVVVGRSMFRKGQDPLVNMINTGRGSVSLEKGTLLGYVFPCEEVMVDEVNNLEDKREKSESEDVSKKIDGLLGNCGNLGIEEKDKLRDLLIEFEEVFAKDDFDLGKFTAVEHEIDTGDARPIKIPMRRNPIHKQQEIDRQIDKMLAAGVIKPSTSSWASAPHLVEKPDGTFRFTIDYRQLNGVTRKDVYPLPNMGDCVDSLAGVKYFSKMDCNSAFWQIPMSERDAEKTAFRTRQGLYEFVKLPFGLTNSPSTYMRAMNMVLNGLNWRVALAFLDDICVIGKSVEDHLGNLRLVLQRLKEYGLRLKPKKCFFFQKKVEFLGRMIGEEGMTLTDESVETIQKWPRPTNVKEVQAFVGLLNFHRLFIKGFA